MLHAELELKAQQECPTGSAVEWVELHPVFEVMASIRSGLEPGSRPGCGMCCRGLFVNMSKTCSADERAVWNKCDCSCCILSICLSMNVWVPVDCDTQCFRMCLSQSFVLCFLQVILIGYKGVTCC